jgi:thioredoxin-related protein
MNDPRTEEVKEILLDDGQEENIEFARKYKITATPTLIVVDENDEKVEEYVGGVPITQNIVELLDKYYVS